MRKKKKKKKHRVREWAHFFLKRFVYAVHLIRPFMGLSIVIHKFFILYNSGSAAYISLLYINSRLFLDIFLSYFTCVYLYISLCILLYVSYMQYI